MSELTDAIQAGDAARVAALLTENAALARHAENNVTPLLFALYRGRRDIVQLLLDHGAPVSFGEACALGDGARVKELLASEPAALRSRTADGFPPHGMAIFFGHGELARWLIEQGADVNAVAENPMRVAPVHAAASARDLETLRLLLDRGADANAKQQMDYTALHGAAARGDVDMAKLLLEHGARRDAHGEDGKTPADVAREHGQNEFAEWLERG